jgi:nitroimidazol reductase NimA-like FMN-containing flavoprotein (pyridoxamine 5'-phosphate oxidase superfamily)
MDMLGILTRKQCEHVLSSELVGRIGCMSGKKMYIVPITFVFFDNYVYAHSKEGLKIDMLRKNPSVCFEVESRENMRNWRSVLVWGKFEELKNTPAKTKAFNILNDHLSPFPVSESLKPVPYEDPPGKIEKQYRPVFYRISVNEITGRFEKSS